MILLKLAAYRSFFFLISVSAFYDCGTPECSACLPVEIHDAPGIGLDLTTSYGTAAIHMYDGSVIDVAQISARPEYITLLSHLVGAPEPPPLTRYQKYHRVVTILLVPALKQEDLNDAIEYAGLRTWLISYTIFPRRLSESRAHFAGEGNGLCKTYQDLFKCWEEEESMTLETVYFIQFTRRTLYTTISTYTSPFRGNSRTETFRVDYKLVLDSLDDFDSQSIFWAHIRTHLLVLPLKSRRPITKLLLAGESVTDDRFLEVLRDALAEIRGPTHGVASLFQTPELSTASLVNPVFSAARGAARYARWRQEVPYGCAESERCEEERRHQRENADNIKTDL